MGKYNIVLPENVKFIIQKLKENGFRADIVGGPVRDHLLGKSPEDYDITTNARPLSVKEVFSEQRTVDTGIKHGTVSLILSGNSYEITTYRIDGEYNDSRHPESVEFTEDLREDLSRRDFTMNAIAYNPDDGITDPFGGEADILEKTIRAVGDPDKRFNEDALRILRGVRFASTLGFAIEKDTRRSIFATKSLLSKVSAERIYTEWRKLLSAEHAYSVLLEYRDVIAEFLPEIKDAPLPKREAFSRADYLTRMLGLFCLGGRSGDDFYSAMRRLKTDSVTAEVGRCALSSLGMFELDKDSDIGRMLYSLGEERAVATVRLGVLIGKYRETAIKAVEDYIAAGRPYRLSQLAVDGGELKGFGLRGKEIGQALDLLMLKVIDGECENEREELLRYLSR